MHVPAHKHLRRKPLSVPRRVGGAYLRDRRQVSRRRLLPDSSEELCNAEGETGSVTSLSAWRPGLTHAPSWAVPAAAGGGGSLSSPEGGTDSLWGGGHGDLWSHSQQRSGSPEETRVQHLAATGSRDLQPGPGLTEPWLKPRPQPPQNWCRHWLHVKWRQPPRDKLKTHWQRGHSGDNGGDRSIKNIPPWDDASESRSGSQPGPAAGFVPMLWELHSLVLRWSGWFCCCHSRKC